MGKAAKHHSHVERHARCAASRSWGVEAVNLQEELHKIQAPHKLCSYGVNLLLRKKAAGRAGLRLHETQHAASVTVEWCRALVALARYRPNANAVLTGKVEVRAGAGYEKWLPFETLCSSRFSTP